jgi:hypothetical protein
MSVIKMPCETYWQSHGVIKRLVGKVSCVELRDAIIATQADPGFDKLRYVIADCLDCTDFVFQRIEVDEIAALGKAAALSNRYIKIAIVATLPSAIAGATQYLHSPLNAYPTRIFSDMDDATQWLEIE